MTPVATTATAIALVELRNTMIVLPASVRSLNRTFLNHNGAEIAQVE
jgi:hypothetical protein